MLLVLNDHAVIESGSSVAFRQQEQVQQSKPGSKGTVFEL